MSRHPVPSPEELAGLDDEVLERLAIEWRARASRGTKQAYGVAHALEVEWRQRARVSRAQQLPQPVVAPRRWWKFWQSSPGPGSPPSP
ncbi:hypothetical protein ABL840_20685 [Variovorax sp. NFACC27]|jgi:hypothetical protein|uniref:Uncharacterized protein n=1 Tax=Variovorax gossypii TaxID=1679495 RepID=A0A431TH99_9BURK|nr:hypothetical protein EJP69_19445 [Variovorax gossypii]SEF33666.1 hypothetical protein SAMN03159371_06681 [Variovorax sp. NFACC28]SEG96545.1 hypothetical protein SAMN03159365_06595 [Variovorax sp. NFACC29]SEM43513.1 hypothetical protein SAMN05518845_12539 [Variovorax sp. YR750]SFD97626.1 hypothetical protein SAMN03159379_06944 [Variovorax sp. NFACC26]SFH14920.1 hypothetical protein SAMN03159447_06918 [Variovorax sp. NFACC27]